jgi:hypothetical protein
MNQRVYVAGDVSMNSRLSVLSDVSLNRNAEVLGKSILRDDVSMNQRFFVGGDVSFNNRLYIVSDVSMNRRLMVGGDTSLNGNLYLSKNLTLGGSSIITIPSNSLKSGYLNNYDISANGRFVTTDTTTQIMSGVKTFNGGLYYTGASINGNTYSSINSYNTFFGDSQVATTAYVASAIQYLVGNAPSALDTIYEIAQSLNSDPSAVVSLTNSIGLKVNRAGDNITGNLGVGNVVVGNLYTFDVNGTAHVSGNTTLDSNLNITGSIMQF